MHKRTVCVVITARPSYSRIKTALEAINTHGQLELQLVVAGSALLSRYGNAVDFIENDGFIVNEKVFMVLEGENPTSMAKTTGLGIMELATVFYNLKPDIVVAIADRFETISVSIAAAYQNIPLVHIQGGEVTGNIDEKVRHANTKLADIHFVANQSSSERVIKLGEDPEFVFNTGCPSIDIAAKVKNQPNFDFDLYTKYGGVGFSPDYRNGYIVVMQHPVTTEYHESSAHVIQTLDAISQIHLPTFWFWPNVDAGADGTSNAIRHFRETHQPKHIHFFKNMESEDFLRLLINSKVLVGNSSVGIRECAYLGVPVVNIGSRQNRRDRGNNVIDVDYNKNDILNAILKWMTSDRPMPSTVYGDGNAGKKIADILAQIPLRHHKTITY